MCSLLISQMFPTVFSLPQKSVNLFKVAIGHKCGQEWRFLPGLHQTDFHRECWLFNSEEKSLMIPWYFTTSSNYVLFLLFWLRDSRQKFHAVNFQSWIWTLLKRFFFILFYYRVLALGGKLQKHFHTVTKKKKAFRSPKTRPLTVPFIHAY